MRIDKYLKVSRIIKRRTVAKDACDQGRVSVNGRVIKAGYEVVINDEIEIVFGSNTARYKVLAIVEHTKKENASDMFELL